MQMLDYTTMTREDFLEPNFEHEQMWKLHVHPHQQPYVLCGTTKPNIFIEVKVVRKFIANLDKKQWEVVKGAIWFLSGMISERLCLRVSKDVIGFSNFDYV